MKLSNIHLNLFIPNNGKSQSLQSSPEILNSFDGRLADDYPLVERKITEEKKHLPENAEGLGESE